MALLIQPYDFFLTLNTTFFPSTLLLAIVPGAVVVWMVFAGNKIT
jgi:hypothetical protein